MLFNKSKMAIPQAIIEAKTLVRVCMNAAIKGHKDFCVELFNKLADTVGLNSLLLHFYDNTLKLESCKVSQPAIIIEGQLPPNFVSNSNPFPTDTSRRGGGPGEGFSLRGGRGGVVQIRVWVWAQQAYLPKHRIILLTSVLILHPLQHMWQVVVTLDSWIKQIHVNRR